MNNRDKLLNSQHQTIELDEDMLKSYDEKSQQREIGNQLNLIQQETQELNDDDDFPECNNFDKLMDETNHAKEENISGNDMT